MDVNRILIRINNTNIQLLCCTSETIIMLNGNYTLIKLNNTSYYIELVTL